MGHYVADEVSFNVHDAAILEFVIEAYLEDHKDNLLTQFTSKYSLGRAQAILKELKAYTADGRCRVCGPANSLGDYVTCSRFEGHVGKHSTRDDGNGKMILWSKPVDYGAELVKAGAIVKQSSRRQ